MPDLVIVEGFEHGVTANGTGGNLYNTVNSGGTLNIVASRRGSGARALERAASASGGSYQLNLPSSSPVVVAVFYVYFTALSLGATRRDIFQLRNSGNTIANIGVLLTGGVHKFRALAGAATQDGLTISLNTMYRVELRATVDDPTDAITVDWQINGAAQTQVVGTTVQTTITNVLFGNATNLGGGETMTCEWDDMGVSTTSGDYPIGDIEVVSLTPSNLNIAGSTSPTKFNTDGGIDPVAGDYALLDDAPLTGGFSDYIAQDTIDAAAFIEVEFADPTGTPMGVSVSAAIANDASATCRYELRSRQSDATEVATQATVNPTTAGAYLRHWIPPPSGGWTTQKLTDLVVRFGYSTDVTPLPRFSSFMVSYARNPNVKSGTTQIGVGVASPATAVAARAGAAAGALGIATPSSEVTARSGAGVTAAGVAIVTAAVAAVPETHSGATLVALGVAAAATGAGGRRGATLVDEGVVITTAEVAGRLAATQAAVAAAVSSSIASGHQGAAAVAMGIAAPLAASLARTGTASTWSGVGAPSALLAAKSGVTLLTQAITALAQGHNSANMREGATRLAIGIAMLNCARRSRHGLATPAGTSRRGMATPAGTSRRGQPTPDCP